MLSIAQGQISNRLQNARSWKKRIYNLESVRDLLIGNHQDRPKTMGALLWTKNLMKTLNRVGFSRFIILLRLIHLPDDGLVACPICGTRMKMESINLHLDKCTGAPSKSPGRIPDFAPPSFKKSSKPPERLPKLSYSLFKETALRKKLLELGISAAGNKPLLERRHTEWVTLWNANCDSSRPRKKGELLHDLETWERTQGGGAFSGSGLRTGSDIRSKAFDGAGWSAKHEDSFRDLIVSARKKLAIKRATEPSQPDPRENMEELHNAKASEYGTVGPLNLANVETSQHENLCQDGPPDCLTPKSQPYQPQDVQHYRHDASTLSSQPEPVSFPGPESSGTYESSWQQQSTGYTLPVTENEKTGRENLTPNPI
jgi:hypothetical protein